MGRAASNYTKSYLQGLLLEHGSLAAAARALGVPTGTIYAAASRANCQSNAVSTGNRTATPPKMQSKISDALFLSSLVKHGLIYNRVANQLAISPTGVRTRALRSQESGGTLLEQARAAIAANIQHGANGH